MCLTLVLNHPVASTQIVQLMVPEPYVDAELTTKEVFTIENFYNYRVASDRYFYWLEPKNEDGVLGVAKDILYFYILFRGCTDSSRFFQTDCPFPI